MSDGQLKAHEHTEEHNLKIVFDRNSAQDDALIDTARQIWADHFGLARAGFVKTLFGKAASSDSANAKMSEIAFLRKRRQEVGEALGDLDTSNAAEIMRDACAREWTPKQQHELLFQRGKHLDRKLEALEDGQLLDSEIDVALTHKLEVEKKQREKAAAERQKKADRAMRQLKPKPPTFSAMRAPKIFVEASASHVMQKLNKSAIALNREGADIIIAADAPNPGTRALLRATCMGLFVATPDLAHVTMHVFTVLIFQLYNTSACGFYIPSHFMQRAFVCPQMYVRVAHLTSLHCRIGSMVRA